MNQDNHFMRQAIQLAYDNVARGGQPFGAVLVRDGQVLATAVNEIHLTRDPTAHAELVAVRAASMKLGSPDLAGSVVYASGQPCPMCLAAMRLAGVAAVTFAYSNEDGAAYGLSSAALAADLARPLSEQAMPVRHDPQRIEGAVDLFADWKQRQDAAR